MGIFDFARDAGSSIFSAGDEDRMASALAQRESSPEAGFAYAQVLERLNDDTARRLRKMADELGFAETIEVHFDAMEGRVTLSGHAPTQAEREKLVLLMGNHQGVAQVVDRLRVTLPAPPARFYTVVKGDTLPKIAKATYGDALQYPAIFEANRPLLKDPDLIYPGQVLRLTH